MEQLKDVMTYHDLMKEMKNHDISHDISSINKGMISKNDYFYLVDILTNWRVFYPKAQIKKYGARNCWEAMIRTKASNARVKGAYFTTTVRSLVNEGTVSENKPIENEKHINYPNDTKTPPKTHSSLRKIENWQQARQYLCDYYDGKIEKNDEVIDFVNHLRKQYNFG